MRRRRWIFILPAAILGIAVVTVGGGALVMYLWNWLGPTLFGWRQITFWQAWGVLALCRILFGGLGVRGPSRSEARRRIRERMAERWEQMSPEEREKYRRSWRGRCAPFEPPSPTPAP